MPVHFRFKSVDLLIPAVLLLTAKSVTVTRRAAAVHFLIRRVTNADGLHQLSFKWYKFLTPPTQPLNSSHSTTLLHLKYFCSQKT